MTEAKIKLFRGGQNASLPEQKTDGALYILTKDNQSGEMYTDIGDSRIKIGGSANINTSAYWSQISTASNLGTLYVITDGFAGEPGLKIGDGETPVKDLPFVSITPSKITYWDNKITCYLGEDEEGHATENLYLTQDNISKDRIIKY